MKVVKVWDKDEYINVSEIESIEVIRNTIEFFDTVIYDIVIYVKNTNGDYHRPVYRATSKKDCYITLEVFLDMINDPNNERHPYRYIIDLEKMCTTNYE